jgi:hypothetical protein
LVASVILWDPGAPVEVADVIEANDVAKLVEDDRL